MGTSTKIDAAAQRLADASYPFLKDTDWSSPLGAKMSGFSGVTLDALKAVDKALLMGYSTNMGALKEAADAHVKAIGSMDAKGLTTKADYQAILAGLGKVVATANDRSVFDVYNGFKPIVDSRVPEFLMSSVKASDAMEAYKGFLEFNGAYIPEHVPERFPGGFGLRRVSQPLLGITQCTKYRSCIVGEVNAEANGRISALA